MNKFGFRLSGLLLAVSLLGAALPADARKGRCKFNVAGLSLSFGALDPASGSNVSAPVSVGATVGNCRNGQMTISGDNGRNYNGTRNLKNAAGDLIPYSLAGLPQTLLRPGNNNYVPFTFSGSILGSAYANASAGSYSDQVIISVTP